MEYRWIGALLIVCGCGGFGFSMAASYRREEYALRQLISALDYMTCELQFRLTPLPELCDAASRECRGPVGQVLAALSRELEYQISPDVTTCMDAALVSVRNLPVRAEAWLRQLGSSLGRFDLKGQLSGLEHLRSGCRREMEEMLNHRDERLRSYQTLGLCTGAALAIILI